MNALLSALLVGLFAGLASTGAAQELPPSLPLPTALTESTSRVDPSPGAQVAVHILEKYDPLATKIVVGTYVPETSPDFQIMFSFKAFAFNEANAMAANCFGIFNSASQWRAISTRPFVARADDEPAFCVRRDVEEDDSESFAIAQFPDAGPANATLVLWSTSSLATISAEALNRGFPQPPVASFRVQKLQVWQSIPVVTLVTNVTVITAASKAAAAALCPPDPSGALNRKIEGGNYYEGIPGKPVVMLCVTYVQRSRHLVDVKEQFFSDTRLVVKSIWRLLICPFVSDAVQDVSIDDDALFTAKDDDDLLMCYTPSGLFDEDDKFKEFLDPSHLLKRITITEETDGYEKRVQIQNHDKSAWNVRHNALDPATVNQF